MSKKKCLIFGNCQTFVIMEILKTSILKNDYIFDNFSTHIKTIDELDILYEILHTYDLIIIQPHYNYKNTHRYNIKSIMTELNNNCITIIIPSSHFDFYYPYLTYSNVNGIFLQTPFHYHDKNIIDLFNKYKDINIIKEKYIEMLNNDNLITTNDLDNMANKSILELKRRENIYTIENYDKKTYFITVSNFIEENYKKKLLFYSMNHPTSHLFKYIIDEILNILNVSNMNYILLDYLNNMHPPLYKCLNNIIEFNINDYNICLNKKMNVNEMIETYYEEYIKHEYIQY